MTDFPVSFKKDADVAHLLTGALDGIYEKVGEDLEGRKAKCYANIDRVSGSCKSFENESIL